MKSAAKFHPWPNPDDAAGGHALQTIRLVTSFATTQKDVDDFVALVRG
jgi:threonine aldolase